MPSALITGITGQDGSYLSEFLLERGYDVHGLVRDPARAAGFRIGRGHDRLQIHSEDFSDAGRLAALVKGIGPDEVYHLAAQTHVAQSTADPLSTLQINVLGTARLLSACRQCRRPPRLFHASTSLVFGEPRTSPQDETTEFRPTNPYAASKACATDLVRIARDTEGFFFVNGICYNHESPRRDPTFVTAKICRAAARIRKGLQTSLTLGHIGARRDWGDAREFVSGFWSSLQADEPRDYVFATGVLHSVEDVLSVAFGTVGLEWRNHVVIDPTLFRPSDPCQLVGNASRAHQKLGWKATGRFEDLIAEMTRCALEASDGGPASHE
ncbi:MAG: GDP-mannose 4,6-dehydratase [Verrucomicrobiales bacterium]|nr:GDP-mannose 4,6-dehydratase [Verrucomicrobiales bacterium]